MLRDDALPQQRPNDIRHTVGPRARRKKPEILPSSVHQINVAGMVDRIVLAGRWHLGVIDFVRTGGLPDRARIAGQRHAPHLNRENERWLPWLRFAAR
jgi:hypothetical protein